MTMNQNYSRLKWWLLAIVSVAIGFSEFLGDYVKLRQCSWPEVNNSAVSHDQTPVRAMLLADIHLLGPYHGHWLDKLYREWHMHRSFQASIQLFQPNVVFILGDLFDEGQLVTNSDFEVYVNRFHKLFHTPDGIPVISAVGNHDVGFHYMMTQQHTNRFNNKFNATTAELITLKGVHFVMLNSMTMEGDGCHFCQETQRALLNISKKLKCLKDPKNCKDLETIKRHKNYSHPVLLQHFPTYRRSDNVCRDGDTDKFKEFRERWEVLSKEATDELGELLQPRLAFAGHSHDYCYSINRWGREEYTLASYNWRNKVKPSFLMATITATHAAVSKCDMLPQQTVISTYVLAAALSIITSIIFVFFCRRIRLKIVGRYSAIPLQRQQKT